MLDFPYLMSCKFKKKNIIFNLVIKIILYTNSFLNNFIIRIFFIVMYLNIYVPINYIFFFYYHTYLGLIHLIRFNIFRPSSSN